LLGRPNPHAPPEGIDVSDRPGWIDTDGDRLAARFVAALRQAGSDVSIDLTDEPPALLARTPDGRVFVAAWPTDDGLCARLRLDSLHAVGVPISDGALNYEVVVRTVDQVDDIADMFAQAYADTGHS
jgi:hypothetical protein